MSMQDAVNLSVAPHGFGVLAFRGPDAAHFLNGQLSANIEKLASGQSTLAGLHNPQGRVLALLALVRTTPEEILTALPAELPTEVAQRLRKFVLRAKVRIEDESAALRVLGIASAGRAPAGSASLGWGTRRLLLVPVAQLEDFTLANSVAAWEAADIREGLPQVYAATRESFVAQMLNLDLLAAIAFDKGCYTGQEVIARAHYRGRVKRRMQRWHANSAVEPKPGDSVRSADGRSLSVVRVARSETGFELLAVGPFEPNAPADSAPAAQPPGVAESPPVDGPLPLPYALPD